jgi:XTP/dITP diphosphohydrolase
LLFASHNQAKILEVQSLLANLPLHLIFLSQLSQIDPSWAELAKTEVNEVGDTFDANARLKANYYAQRTKLPTIADDSGLLVHAFNGFPGVASNRWQKGSDVQRNQALLQKMQKLADRQAAYISVVCLIDPLHHREQFFEGKVEGEIAITPKGKAGFGYDPIFIPSGYNQTFGQLGDRVKNQISHRSRALSQLASYLRANL